MTFPQPNPRQQYSPYSAVNLSSASVYGSYKLYCESNAPQFAPSQEQSSKSEQEQGCRVPLTYKLLAAWYDYVGTGRNLSYNDMIELESMCDAALDDGTITSAENNRLRVAQDALRERARMLRLASYHSDLYASYLRHIFQMVYSRKVETANAWKTTAASIDQDRPSFRDGEYDTLVKLIQDHSVEIENAVYRANNAEDMCVVNTTAKNYVSYQSLKNTAFNISQAYDWVTKHVQELFSVKAELAFQCGCITGEQWAELNKIAAAINSEADVDATS